LAVSTPVELTAKPGEVAAAGHGIVVSGVEARLLARLPALTTAQLPWFDSD